jgi:hypothetical protein
MGLGFVALGAIDRRLVEHLGVFTACHLVSRTDANALRLTCSMLRWYFVWTRACACAVPKHCFVNTDIYISFHL